MDLTVFEVHARMERRHWWFVARRRILHRLLARVAPVSMGGLIVDVGCGTGGNIGPLAARYECVGVDPVPAALAVGRRRYPGVRFLQGASATLSEIGRKADVLFLTDVLEHVEDDAAAFRQCFEAVRPGGHVIITVPANPELFGPHDVSHGHQRRYTRETLARLVERRNVEVLLMSYFNARLYPLLYLARKLTGWTGRSVGAAGTDLALPPSPINRLLTSIFAGEADVLIEALDEGAEGAYRRGLSLVAVLRVRGDAAISGAA